MHYFHTIYTHSSPPFCTLPHTYMHPYIFAFTYPPLRARTGLRDQAAATHTAGNGSFLIYLQTHSHHPSPMACSSQVVVCDCLVAGEDEDKRIQTIAELQVDAPVGARINTLSPHSPSHSRHGPHRCPCWRSLRTENSLPWALPPGTCRWVKTGCCACTCTGECTRISHLSLALRPTSG